MRTIKFHICTFFAAFFMTQMFFLSGCGHDSEIILSQAEQSVKEQADEAALSGKAGVGRQTEQSVRTEDDRQAAYGGKEEENLEAQPTIFVHVTGAVKAPGVYELYDGARVFEAVKLAGGFAPDAAKDSINQAQTLSDGQQLRIPTEDEWEQARDAADAMSGAEGVMSETGASEESGQMVDDQGRVNINLADLETLCTIEGIGKTRAQAILTYRTEHGAFQSIEDIKKVKGIKEGLFSQIKDKIKV